MAVQTTCFDGEVDKEEERMISESSVWIPLDCVSKKRRWIRAG
jgi:hypothetical protein